MRKVAELLGVSTASIYVACNSGKLPSFRVGNAIRVVQDDLRAYIERQRNR